MHEIKTLLYFLFFPRRYHSSVFGSVTEINIINICLLGNFSCFCCRLLTFFKMIFSKTSFKNTTIKVSNGLGPDQDRHSVGPDLGPNCLPWLSADGISRR